jgi:hypothetical protein
MKLEFCGHIFEEWNIKIYENPSSGGPIYSMQADSQTDVQTDVTNFIIAFRDFSNSPKN